MQISEKWCVMMALASALFLFPATADFDMNLLRAGESDLRYYLEFDGEQGRVVLEDTREEFQHFLEGRGSISLWVNPSKILIGRSHSNRQYAISAGGRIEPHDRDLNIGINERGSWYARLADGSEYMLSGVSAEPTPEPDKWYNVSVVYGGDDRGLYVDGEKVASWEEFSGNTGRWRHDIHIGYAPDENRNWFGAIRDVRFFDRNLSSSEVRDVMKDKPLNDEEESVVGYWPMDEEEGDTVYDRSARENHGKITGAVWNIDKFEMLSVDPETILPVLIKLAGEDPSVRVREKVLQVLGEIDVDAETKFNVFREIMMDKEEPDKLRITAVNVIKESGEELLDQVAGHEDTVKILHDFVQHGEWDLRVASSDTLEMIGEEPGDLFDWPMTVINSEELAIVRERIEQGAEPQASAFKKLIEDAEEAQDFTPDPPEHMHIMGGYASGSNLSEKRAWLEREAGAAYVSALSWLYSGEQHYAEKAVEIVNAWADKRTSFDGFDSGLQLGSWFNRMLYTADILKGYDGWSSEEFGAFENWWRHEVLNDVRGVMGRSNNWGDAGLLGIITAAAVFEDRELMSEALNRLDSYFDDWKMRVHDSGAVYFPDEVTRRGRASRGHGGRGARGITYTAYTLTSLVQAMEIARYAGCDWWDRQTASGANMKRAVESYFRWNDLEEDFPWNDSPIRIDPEGVRKNPYEIANNHFPGEIEGLKEWLDNYRPVDGRQGDPYVTLNRGDIPPQKKD